MKLLQKIFVLTLLTATITSASTALIHTKATLVLTTKPYSIMSTQELQIEVEKLSQSGNLPFEMGLELMKRWKKA
jgi:cell division protein FtsL